MNRTTSVLLVLLATVFASANAGCVARVSYRAQYAPTTLVAVAPGVWVVHDYPEAIFYSGSSYWWWNGGVWYTSRYADYGWARVQVSSVPVQLRQIQSPRVYVHYRATAQTRSVPRAHVRGTYQNAPPPARGRTQAAQPNDRGRAPAAQPNDRGRAPAAQPNDRGRAPAAQPNDRGRGPAEQPGDRGRGPAEQPGDRGRGSDNSQGRGRGR